jgi:hypothetical protein
MLGYVGTYGMQPLMRWADMTADGTDVGFNNAESDFQGSTPLWSYRLGCSLDGHTHAPD